MSTLTAAAPAPVTESRTGSRLLDALLRFRALGIVLALVVLTAVTTAVNPRFLSGQSVRDILLATSILLLLSAGLTVVVLTRGIDLSVGSTLGLSAFAVASTLRDNPGLGTAGAVAVGLGVGALCGLVNAAIVTLGKVPPLVATLGTLYIYRGLVFFWAGGSRISAGDLPRSFLELGTARILGVPVLFLVAGVVVLAVGVFLASYRQGRDMYAIGSNPEAARLAGVRTGRRLLTAYLLSGSLAGLGGVLYTARFGTVDASAGTGLELSVVAAVVVGGVAIFGGSGTVYGAALGALLLTVIGNALPVLSINQFWQQAIVGALILGAIGLDRLVAVRVARALERKDSHVR